MMSTSQCGSRLEYNSIQRCFLNCKELIKYVTATDKNFYQYIIPNDAFKEHFNMLFSSRKVFNRDCKFQLIVF